MATQLISRVRKAFDVELPLRCLFEFPTISELATVLEEYRKTDQEHGAEIITRAVDSEAEELLARIDELSDEDVDVLLNDVLAEGA